MNDRYGSQLARIESFGENNFLHRLINRQQKILSVNRNEFWIGMIFFFEINIFIDHLIINEWKKNKGILIKGVVAQQTEDEDAYFLWSDGTIVSRYVGFWNDGQPDYRVGTCAKVFLSS